MAIKEKVFTLDLNNEVNSVVFSCKQDDSLKLKIKITSEHKTINMSDNSISFYVRKSDGKIVSQNDCFFSDNYLIINCKEQVTKSDGIACAEVEFKKTDGTITSSNFYFNVIARAVSKEDIDSYIDVTELTLLEKYTQQCKDELAYFKKELKIIEEMKNTKALLEEKEREAKATLEKLKEEKIKLSEKENSVKEDLELTKNLITSENQKILNNFKTVKDNMLTEKDNIVKEVTSVNKEAKINYEKLNQAKDTIEKEKIKAINELKNLKNGGITLESGNEINFLKKYNGNDEVYLCYRGATKKISVFHMCDGQQGHANLKAKDFYREDGKKVSYEGHSHSEYATTNDLQNLRLLYNGSEINLANGFSSGYVSNRNGYLYLNYRGASTMINKFLVCDGLGGGSLTTVQAKDFERADGTRVSYQGHTHKDHHPYVAEPLTIRVSSDTIGFDTNSRRSLYVEKSKDSSSLEGKKVSYFWNKSEMKIETVSVNASTSGNSGTTYCTLQHQGNFTTIHLCIDSMSLSNSGTGHSTITLPFSVKDWKSYGGGMVYRVWESSQYVYDHWKACHFGSTIKCVGNKIDITVQNNNTSNGITWVGYTCTIFVERN